MLCATKIYGESRPSQFAPQAALLRTPLLVSCGQDKNGCLDCAGGTVGHDAVKNDGRPEARLFFDAKDCSQTSQRVTRKSHAGQVQLANERALGVSVQALQFIHDES